MVDKKKYYLTVASGDIVENKEDTNYDFEIYASPQELDQLQVLFEELYSADISTHFRALIPFKEYHSDEENDRYDRGLKNIYELVHRLGTKETKETIEHMNIL
ncbi:hypothetical protein ERICIV_01316 [Paenibacillus larvae subsp. larvae]|uniref:Hydrolase n=1 Tax=Paenibacillus larvae subsp. larvae TaxID=147375 RepID=A0A2L1UBG3_9BACL|nr:hypothetical protein [Paenibacillus larvae]AQT86021.1 hypothetical protein B1222_18945 [Paenibacillus larvae subsp. pulvifaciens]AQZ45732.1 hypothetical protein B5S25_03065 [Paenibacillus larvae subsp. pulvifaciens]AVF25492.1 hypothetical protein ERICIII_01295 [Paenibacillus larvae subsp. larvae]AVF30269.1 hypothetical protein ERICIV_01316 [Paenibacillus larvae subsp. larvae]MBH0340789.1 hypothetical protein [Paenibacillus larvae]